MLAEADREAGRKLGAKVPLNEANGIYPLPDKTFGVHVGLWGRRALPGAAMQAGEGSVKCFGFG